MAQAVKFTSYVQVRKMFIESSPELIRYPMESPATGLPRKVRNYPNIFEFRQSFIDASK